MNKPALVINIKPSRDEAVKPSELIQITGHQSLSLFSRRSITILWHNAHRQGIAEGKDYTIPLADLRTDGHHGSEMIKETIKTLMTTLLEVRDSEGRVETMVQFLGGNDLRDKDRAEGSLTYSFDKRLVKVLKDSSIWGKIAIPVLMSFGTKYAVSFYEHLAQWSNLDYKSTQQFTLEQFRQVMGVEEGKYATFGGLNKHIFKKSMDEINALAPFNVSVTPIKTGKRVTDVMVGWWMKSETELKEAYAELNRSKVGRRARIEGKVEHVNPIPRVEEQMRKMRLKSRLPNPSHLE